MFKACAPLGRSSHPSMRCTNSIEPERERERGGGGEGRREEGGGGEDVHILNQTMLVCVSVLCVRSAERLKLRWRQ